MYRIKRNLPDRAGLQSEALLPVCCISPVKMNSTVNLKKASSRFKASFGHAN